MAATSIFSIFGECTGNVRSTPTPNDCLRTVKVSRAPAPWRLITIPSNTWIRRRCPSITWKWTRTVSPALNRGMPVRSWARSSVSMILLMGRRPDGRRPMLAKRNPARGPVDGEDLPDHLLARHRPPRPGIARMLAVVAEHDVVGRRHGARLLDVVPAPLREDVRLDQALAVDEDDAVLHPPGLSGQHDQPLDEGSA